MLTSDLQTLAKLHTNLLEERANHHPGLRNIGSHICWPCRQGSAAGLYCYPVFASRTQYQASPGEDVSSEHEDGNHSSDFQETQTHMPRYIPRCPHSVSWRWESCSVRGLFRLILMASRPCEGPWDCRLYQSGRSISITHLVDNVSDGDHQAGLASSSRSYP